MIALIDSLTHWHWLILGMALLIAEMLGAGGFLIGVAIASRVMGAVVAFFDLHWHTQLILFAVMSVAFTLIYWKKFRTFNEGTDQPMLNDRAAQLVGRKVKASEAIVNGQGKIQIDDTFWKVKCDGEVEAGGLVDIVGHDGMVLEVKVAN